MTKYCVDHENKYLNERNQEYENRLDSAMRAIENYQDEMNKSVFELDLYKNQVDRYGLDPNWKYIVNLMLMITFLMSLYHFCDEYVLVYFRS